MKIHPLTILLFALVFTGCVGVPPKAPTAPTALSPSGGNRAGGIVEFSYEYLWFDPSPDVNSGTAEALNRCIAWGYKGVLPFDKVTKRCTNPGKDGCNGWFATYHYQCTVVANPTK